MFFSHILGYFYLGPGWTRRHTLLALRACASDKIMAHPNPSRRGVKAKVTPLSWASHCRWIPPEVNGVCFFRFFWGRSSHIITFFSVSGGNGCLGNVLLSFFVNELRQAIWGILTWMKLSKEKQIPHFFSSGKKWIFIQTGLNVVESLSKNISSTIESSPKDSKDEKTQRNNLLLLKYNSTWPELHTQIRPNTWATWFFRMGEKNNMSQKFEKGPKWTWKLFHCYSIAFNHSKSAGKYSVCSFPGRFCFHLGCLFFWEAKSHFGAFNHQGTVKGLFKWGELLKVFERPVMTWILWSFRLRWWTFKGVYYPRQCQALHKGLTKGYIF